MKKNDIPVIELSNGLRVANFSSPHTFTFEDGSVLPACSEERSKSFNIDMCETPVNTLNIRNSKVKLITVNPRITENVKFEVDRLEMDHTIDIVIVPRPVLEALQHWAPFEYYNTFVTGRLKDRIKKILFIDKFCR